MHRGLGFSGCFGINQPLGLDLPVLHELLRLALIGNGELEDGGLLGRDHAMDELAALHVAPLEVRPVPSTRILGAAAVRFTAELGALE